MVAKGPNVNCILKSRDLVEVYQIPGVEWYRLCVNVVLVHEDLTVIYGKSEMFGSDVLPCRYRFIHYCDVIMSAMASQIICASSVYSTVCSGEDQRKHFWCENVPGLGVGISPVTGEFPAQWASNAGNVAIWWRHDAVLYGLTWNPQIGL